MQLPFFRPRSRSLRLGFILLSRNLIKNILCSKDLLLRIVKLQLIQLQLLPKTSCLLLSTVSTSGCLTQSVKVLECTALRSVSTVGLYFEMFGSNNKKGVNLTNFISQAFRRARRWLVDPSVVIWSDGEMLICSCGDDADSSGRQRKERRARNRDR
jgi:hypothetical protein